MEYNFNTIEKKWQAHWKDTNAYRVENDFLKPKCYVLDMFPYPSGAGLHVGHPLGYIASDIYSRYKRLKGFNVLHPMGFDSFGLPAEQYALETGQHPANTTAQNIKTFKAQLDKIGFCYDWEREVQTSDESFYRWTQWIFLQLYKSYYCRKENKARPIAAFVAALEANGIADELHTFSAEQWKLFSEEKQQQILMNYRLAFVAWGEVNWCEALGTVLANDEVVNGLSERGGHMVEKKRMRQWYLRITAYADRLLEGLEKVSFSESMKDMQRNWIGKSEGCELVFATPDGEEIKVYTTRPDTIFGVDFLVLAPEHPLVEKIVSTGEQANIDAYLTYVKSRSDRERMAEVKQVTGCFTGAYATNPFDGRQIPIWIAEYVLAGYGTGAIMAVPCGDQRDFEFATHFNIAITNIIGDAFNGEEANATKEATLANSGFLNGMRMRDAIDVAIAKIESLAIGKRKVNFRMRDAGFSRQRYWGEPFPVLWQKDTPYPISESELPLVLPFADTYGPGPNGEGPLANMTDWVNVDGQKRETSTMPGYAGSSWYFLRYMDPHNTEAFCDRKLSDYWNQVDIYIGGTEHAVGHLLYSRMWTKVLFDLGHIGFDEPFKKLVNQGMITGKSYFFAVDEIGNIVSYQKQHTTKEFIRFKYGHQHVEANQKLRRLVLENSGSTVNEVIIWEQDEEGDYIVLKEEAEKMSKSKFNVDNPDDVVAKYGADTFRMYEMFLGPVEMSKPWDTKGIEGVHRFLRKLWRLFFDDVKGKVFSNEDPAAAALKTLHKTIKKIDADTASFSYNTAVSAFMVCVNELSEQKCHSVQILQPLLILLSPYAPHIAAELWQLSGGEGLLLDALYPEYNEAYLAEENKEYPVSINGKLRTTISMATSAVAADAEKAVLENEVVLKWLEGKAPKKIIFVPNKMINVVLG